MELVEAYGIGLDLEDERAAALVKSIASTQVEIEGIEDAADRDEAIDRLELVRLTGLRERLLLKLSALKAEAGEQAPAGKVQGGWTSALWRHLHFVRWVDEHRGESSFADTINDPAFKREYDRLEARGEFRDAVR